MICDMQIGHCRMQESGDQTMIPSDICKKGELFLRNQTKR